MSITFNQNNYLLDAESLKLLGSNLHCFRMERQISIKKAAASANLSIEQIDTIERGVCPFLFENYFRLMRCYQIKLFLSVEENYAH